MNPSNNNEKKFWSAIPQGTIAQFVNIYLLDFLLFGYSARDYLDNINVPYDPSVITI